MGAPSDSDPDRPAPQAESLDDAWTTDSPAPSSPPQHDQTTHGFYVEPPVPRSEVNASVSDHDRTTIGSGGDRIVPATADVAKRPFAVLGGNGVTTPREEERKLVQPERSPLAFVIPDEKPDAVPRAGRSNDSSRFVAALIGDQPPPTVQSEVPVIPTMEPALRRGRLRRQWGALAAAVVVGAVVAIKLATSAHAPRAATPETKVAAAPVAQAPAPSPSNAVPEPPQPSAVSGSAAEPEPVAEAAPPETAPPAAPQPVVIASAKQREAPAKSSTAKKSTKPKPKSTAMAKKSSAAKKPSTTKKVTVAKKSKTAGNAQTPKKRSSS